MGFLEEILPPAGGNFEDFTQLWNTPPPLFRNHWKQGGLFHKNPTDYYMYMSWDLTQLWIPPLFRNIWQQGVGMARITTDANSFSWLKSGVGNFSSL